MSKQYELTEDERRLLLNLHREMVTAQVKFEAAGSALAITHGFTNPTFQDNFKFVVETESRGEKQ